MTRIPSTSLRARFVRLFVGAVLIGAAVTGSVAGCGGETQRPDGGTGLLEVGDPPPALQAEDHRGTVVDLRNLGEQTTLVYFYPRDNTPGCTKEACAIRDIWERYTEVNVRVIGVSADDMASHRAFAEEHQLPFGLVSDADLVWASAFGVGSIMGTSKRVSFLIGPNGKIAHVYPGVDPGVHAEQVLADVEKL